MRTLTHLVVVLSFLTTQFVAAQEVKSDQAALFGNLGITSNTNLPDRINACADAVKIAREIPVPNEFLIGGIVIGSAGGVGSLITNLNKKSLQALNSNLRIAQAEVDKTFLKVQQSSASFEDEVPKAVIAQLKPDELMLDMNHRLVYYSQKVSKAAIKFKEGQISKVQRYKEISGLLKKMEKAKADYETYMKKYVNFESAGTKELESLGTKEKAGLFVDSYRSFDTSFSHAIQETEDIMKYPEIVEPDYSDPATELPRNMRGRAYTWLKEDRAIKNYEKEVNLRPTLNELSKNNQLSRRLSLSAVGLGSVVSLTAAYFLLRDAETAKSGHYKLQSAGSGNPRLICVAAMGENSDSSAVQSISVLLGIGDAAKKHNAVKVVASETPTTGIVPDGKTAK